MHALTYKDRFETRDRLFVRDNNEIVTFANHQFAGGDDILVIPKQRYDQRASGKLEILDRAEHSAAAFTPSAAMSC